MQSNVKESTIVNIAKEMLSDISLDEALQLHEDYQMDNQTTICPFCSSVVSDDQLVYVTDSESSWEDPSEAHNECPCCRVELSASSLEKPDFETWLKVTA